MSTALKDLYNDAFFERLCTALAAVAPRFDKTAFLQHIFDGTWLALSLKERMRRITQSLHSHALAADFEQAAQQITEIIDYLRKNGEKNGALPYIFLPDYIEIYGIDQPTPALAAIEHVTEFISCEFAIRPFILRYPQIALAQMLAWAQHPNEHLRRLASEGARPRLPWAIALPPFKKDPQPILPILEQLKADPSEYVRRSVANCLNDIGKDHPQTLIDIAKAWHGQDTQTDRLLKHACRNLLKQGNGDILQLFGVKDSHLVELSAFSLATHTVKLGDYLPFSFQLQNRSNDTIQLRLEYALYFLRQNGTHSKKVFKISERPLAANEKIDINRRHSFRPITTRKYYAGTQFITLIINGEEQEKIAFQLQQ